MISLPDKELVVIDIETTEVALAETARRFPEPVEIGAVRVNSNFDVLGEFEVVLNPNHQSEFSEFSENLTGLSRDIVMNAPPFISEWRKLAEFTRFNGIRLASWGAPFDYAVLKQAYLTHDLCWPHAYPFVVVLSMDYYAAGERGFKYPRWSLKNVCERFSVPGEKKHRALGGARVCLRVLRAIATLDEVGDLP